MCSRFYRSDPRRERSRRPVPLAPRGACAGDAVSEPHVLVCRWDGAVDDSASATAGGGWSLRSPCCCCLSAPGRVPVSQQALRCRATWWRLRSCWLPCWRSVRGGRGVLSALSDGGGPCDVCLGWRVRVAGLLGGPQARSTGQAASMSSGGACRLSRSGSRPLALPAAGLCHRATAAEACCGWRACWAWPRRWLERCCCWF